jgi:hypothetical protein
MSDFEALLKRSFAETEEPVDDGFSAQVRARVSRRVNDGRLRAYAQGLGLATAGAVILYVGAGMLWGPGQEILSVAALEVLRAEDAISDAPAVSAIGQGMQSLGLGLTQILLAAAALVGGAVAYRSNQS